MFITTTTTFESSWAALKQAVADGSIREVLHSKDKIPVTLKTAKRSLLSPPTTKPASCSSCSITACVIPTT